MVAARYTRLLLVVFEPRVSKGVLGGKGLMLGSIAGIAESCLVGRKEEAQDSGHSKSR